MRSAFSDKIFYIIGYRLGCQIFTEIFVNSFGGDMPFLGRFAERFICADAGCLRNLLNVIFCCHLSGLSFIVRLAHIGPDKTPDKHHRTKSPYGIYYGIEHFILPTQTIRHGRRMARGYKRRNHPIPFLAPQIP